MARFDLAVWIGIQSAWQQTQIGHHRRKALAMQKKKLAARNRLPLS